MAECPDEKENQDNIWYSFRTEELELLLAAAGAKSWYGPAGGDPGRPVSREEVNRLLAGMYSKGIVTFAGGRVVMADDQMKIAEIISDASAYAAPASGVRHSVPYVAYFSGGKAAVLRADIAGSGKIIVKLIDEADWPEVLIGECQAGCRIGRQGRSKGTDKDVSGDTSAGVRADKDGCPGNSKPGAELKINSEGLRRAGTELAGCGDVLKRIASELYSTISQADSADREAIQKFDEAQKTLELKGLKLDTMAEVLVRVAGEADQAEKMILDHEALMKAANMKAGESDLAGMAEALDKAVKK